MSRIGLKTIEVPDSVTVTKNGDDITVKGPKGELTRYFDPKITFNQEDGKINFTRSSESDKALHGTERANLASMIEGVVDGYKKTLKLIGVGYRAQAQGNKLTLNVGYSHPVVLTAPEGVSVKTTSANICLASLSFTGSLAIASYSNCKLLDLVLHIPSISEAISIL